MDLPEKIKPNAVQQAPVQWRRWLLWSIIAFIISLGVLLDWYIHQVLYSPIRLSHPVTVVIERGTTLNYFARRLQQRKIIPSAFALKVYARLTHQAKSMKMGEYEITDGERPVDILALIISGRAKMYWVTIPEGKWLSEMPPYLHMYWPEAAINFPQQTRNFSYWKNRTPFPLEGLSLEGYLFPDTYRFPAATSADRIIATMLERFAATNWTAYKNNQQRDGRSLFQVLTLASLVEAEAKVDSERPIIAGVYMNRLRTPGWKLDCDATLIYAKQIRITRVLFRDMTIDSAYNTYQKQGLPPGPINNPGLKSFLAALHPAKVPYYFYVARGDGTHVFSRTLKEQSAVIRQLARGKQ